MAAENTSHELDNILNFRDVSAYINRREQNQHLRLGQLYRSARPDSASSADKQKLQNELGIKTIIDLRSKTEHIEAAQKHAKRVQASLAVTALTSDDRTAEAIKIPGIDYAEINLNGKGFERHLVWQLSYGNLASLVGYMLFGYRLQGISIIGKNVLQKRGLVGLGQDTLQHSGPEIKQVFDVLANPKSYPVLVHCTQGKDRTGLIVMLVLLLCGVSTEAITDDYRKSEPELEPEFEERMKEIASIGLDESFARCPPDFVEETVSFVNEQYGNVEKYLTGIGVSQKQIDTIQTIMMSKS
ncbi:hypothetical protein PMZ80_004647 [Knufia obscura]|uniref:Tyrosine specific protein phosphatases domain-containing protein n=2 Tax=Knufia TaxID=430999 RepID=A0AAN8I5A6_9EURO|nr:hypothetical protein PMZ80_004647 [Knufia obscura]KAK5952639.1 hypothetical protein OHC33_006231 [Knufia fluminis]